MSIPLPTNSEELLQFILCHYGEVGTNLFSMGYSTDDIIDWVDQHYPILLPYSSLLLSDRIHVVLGSVHFYLIPMCRGFTYLKDELTCSKPYGDCR